MKMSDMRAKARAIFGPAIAEPMPKQPNGAKALQQRANARPIPTYKVGGPVKKMPTPAESAASGNRMSRQEGDEMRFMEMIEKLKRPMPTPAESVRSGNRIAREEAADMRRMKMAKGGMPDLTGDGKVTQADVLKGRGVKGFAKGGVQTSSDTARKLATEMGGMKKGGKAKPIELDMSSLEEMSRPRAALPNLESRAAEARNLNAVRGRETSDAAKGKSFKEKFAEEREKQGPNGVFTWRGNTYNTKMAGESSKAAPPRAAAPPPRAAAPPPRAGLSAAAAPIASAGMPAPRGGPPVASAKPTDQALNALADQIMKQREGSFLQGQLTRAEALEEAAKKRTPAPSVTRGYADRGARVLTEREKRVAQNAATERARVKKPSLFESMYDATVNPGYAKGGKVKEPKPKNGLAVIIAIGNPKKPTKKMNGGMMDYAEGGKPVKKMNGGAMAGGSRDMEASKVTRAMAMGGDPMGYMGGGAPMGYAAGGAGKTRKGQAPIKKAQGGAAKVRKGMMTPEGNIIDAMNKMRGK